MKQVASILFFVLFPAIVAWAQPLRIDEFAVKESLLQNGKLAVIAMDTAEQPLEKINGTFFFSLNGLQQELRFHDGVAVIKQPLESSTFIFFKHKNQENTISKLYYIHKKNNELKPYKINGMLLFLIPITILLIAYMFRRFVTAFVLIGLVYAYFHFSKGLNFPNLIQSVLNTLTNLV